MFLLCLPFILTGPTARHTPGGSALAMPVAPPGSPFSLTPRPPSCPHALCCGLQEDRPLAQGAKGSSLLCRLGTGGGCTLCPRPSAGQRLKRYCFIVNDFKFHGPWFHNEIIRSVYKWNFYFLTVTDSAVLDGQSQCVLSCPPSPGQLGVRKAALGGRGQ